MPSGRMHTADYVVDGREDAVIAWDAESESAVADDPDAATAIQPGEDDRARSTADLPRPLAVGESASAPIRVDS